MEELATHVGKQGSDLQTLLPLLPLDPFHALHFRKGPLRKQTSPHPINYIILITDCSVQSRTTVPLVPAH